MTELASEVVRLALRNRCIRNDDIFGMLHYGDDEGNVELHNEDKLLIERIYNDEFIAEAIKAIRVGDFVEIIDTAFEGFGGVIKHMNKSKHKVEVEFDLLGAKRIEVFAIEIVERVECIN